MSSTSLQIDPGKMAGPELGRVISRFAADAESLARVLPSDPHPAIHGLRTTMKKLRSALFLGREELPRKDIGHILELVVFLKNSVAHFRDCEVLRQCLLSLAAQVSSDESDPSFFQSVQQGILPQALPTPPQIDENQLQSLASASKDLRTYLATVPFWIVTRRGLGEALQSTHEKVLRWLKICRKSGTAEDFHEWRKAVKHQATQCLVLQNLYPGTMVFREQAEVLGGVLGELNDLENLRKALTQPPSISRHNSILRILSLIDERVARLHKRAIRLGKKLR